MATRLILRTRLKRRLGLGVVSAVEDERLNEAINSGLARALSDGVPGISSSMFVGSPLGDLAVTAATAARSATIFVSGNSVTSYKVMPHDILTLDTVGTQYLIKDVIDPGSVSIGVPASVTEASQAATITRRSLILPSTGQVTAVIPVGSGDALAREPSLAHRDPFKTGTPRFYEQRHSEGQSASFISLWPAPTDITKQFTIRQSQFKAELDSDTDTLGFPEEVLDAILERARDCYLTWSGSANQNDLTASHRALRDTSDSLRNSSNTKQIFYKT